MAATVEISPEIKESVDRRNGETTWDAYIGFALYCFDVTYEEIGHKFGVSARTVCHRAGKDGWDDKREIVLLERAKRVGVSASKEQEFIRAQECELGRRLMGLGHQILARKDLVATATIADLCRVLELASRLGRLGSGLSLNQVEVHQQFDLSEELQASIDRAYAGHPELGGSPLPGQVIDVAPAVAEVTA